MPEKTIQNLIILALLIIAMANVFDVIYDIQLSASLSHIIEEIIIILVSCTAIAFLAVNLKKKTETLNHIMIELDQSKQQIQQQNERMRSARESYSQIIKQQFDDWNLTKTERETAYLLLKGFSLKEIADIRDIKEKSVRQQASTIYSKSGVAGRHAFAAWFFEDFIN